MVAWNLQSLYWCEHFQASLKRILSFEIVTTLLVINRQLLPSPANVGTSGLELLRE